VHTQPCPLDTSPRLHSRRYRNAQPNPDHSSLSITNPLHHRPPSFSDDNEALYRFPFGIYKGKTLLEVHENYVAYLRMDEAVTASMPGLTVVSRLFDAGEPPIARLSASRNPSSQTPVKEELSSSEHTELPAPPLTIVLPSRSSTSTSDLSDGQYRWDW
jgi:hypothetical protein